MKNINAIIFSNNKASILYNLIESIQIKTDELFDINVLYEATDNKSEDEYMTLEKTCEFNKWGAKFTKTNSTSFKSNLLSALESKQKYTCFLYDTDIFIGDLYFEDIEKKLKDEDVFCFSTTLGLNTTFCNREKMKSVIVTKEQDNDIIVWDWTKHYLNYGNPFYIEGCIYRTKDMFKLSKSINFFTPEEYEQALLIYEDYPRNLMTAYKKNVLKNIMYNE